MHGPAVGGAEDEANQERVRDAYRRSDVESERRRAMAPYVLEEVSGFYVGRELKIPRD